MEPRDDALRWMDAARDPAVVAALQSIFADTSAAIAARGPACWASGRCCNFEAAGHRLYVTGLEAAYTVVRAREIGPGIDGGPGETGTRGEGAPTAQSRGRWHEVSLPQIAAARARGGCPFQQANLCGVHLIKPVACRVYFCDKSAQDWQNDLAEQMHERVRGLHTSHGVPYLYAEWRGLLELVIGAE